MNQTSDNQIPNRKLFKEKTFWIGPFIGGPLVAGYLLAENFKIIGEPEKVKPTWLVTIIATFIIFSGIFLIPEGVNIPSFIIPIIYSAIAVGVYNKYQQQKINEHVESGGLIHSWWRVIGVSVIGLVITLVSLITILLTIDSFNQANITTKKYGLAIQHEIDFDKTNISEIEIDRIAEGFKATRYFGEVYSRFLYVVKNNDAYEISISVVEGIEDNEEILFYFEDLRSKIDVFFPNNEVVFKLVAGSLDNVVKTLQ